jgi:SAM-dependent methyltransferase
MQRNPYSSEAAAYAHLRPTYPSGLFDYLSAVVPATQCAWDCATGTGQSAIQLAQYFDRVIATDESKEMIAQAPLHPKITYRVAEAEDSGLDAHAVDLVTIAAAIHWFDLNGFYAEVRRVLKPGAIIAAWTYYTPVFDNATNVLIQHLVHDILGSYWNERLHYVFDKFRSLPFPFESIDAPSFQSDMSWKLDDLLGYFETWSASLRYYEEHGVHASELIKKQLSQAWGHPNQSKDLFFPLYLRIGRV